MNIKNQDTSKMDWQLGNNLMRLLLCEDTPNPSELEAICTTIENWDYFIRQLEWHRVAGIVWRQKKIIERLVPDDVYQRICHLNRQIRLNSLRHIAYIKRIVREFDQHKVRYLMLKGPVLSQQLYSDPGVRYCRDLDILVEETQLEQAQNLLRRMGFSDAYYNSHDVQKHKNRIRQLNKDCCLFNEAHNVIIELHWRWEINPALYRLNFDCAWRAKSTVYIDDLKIATLNITDNLLYLCVHAAKSSWARLIWLSDIERILKIYPASKVNELLQQAVKTGADKSLRSSYFIVATWFPASVNAMSLNNPEIDRKCVNLGHYGMRVLYQCAYPPRLITLSHQLRLDSNWSYRWYFYSRVIGTTMSDVQLIALPKRFYPLYYLLRPLLWLWRYRGNWKRMTE